jgi:hypothetical protein
MRMYERLKVYFHAYLTSALEGGELSVSLTGHFTPEERSSPLWYILQNTLGRSQSRCKCLWEEKPIACSQAIIPDEGTAFEFA